MHGIGNDFIMLDCTADSCETQDWPFLARSMCDRRLGIGADGLILVQTGERQPFQMRMFNPDGSESEMCGNGVRCFARYVSDRGLTTNQTIRIETGAGVLELTLIGDQVKVNMGPARMLKGEIGMVGDPTERFVEQPIEAGYEQFLGTAVSMGNPHLVIFTDGERVDLERIGPILENSRLFPGRVNVHFAQAINRSEITQRTWERGAGATLACGTGACAVAVAGHQTGRTERSVTVHLPGGDLQVEYLESGEVMMSGPAETVFSGCWGAA